jgi:hypothetical protein
MRSGFRHRFLGRNIAGTMLSDIRAWAIGLACLLCLARVPSRSRVRS